MVKISNLVYWFCIVIVKFVIETITRCMPICFFYKFHQKKQLSSTFVYDFRQISPIFEPVLFGDFKISRFFCEFIHQKCTKNVTLKWKIFNFLINFITWISWKNSFHLIKIGKCEISSKMVGSFLVYAAERTWQFESILYRHNWNFHSISLELKKGHSKDHRIIIISSF